MVDKDELEGLSFDRYQQIRQDIERQHDYRKEANICADYYDGKQSDPETKELLADIGMELVQENLIAPTVDSILGLQTKTRLDWVVKASVDDDFADTADGINMRLNEAEKMTRADKANSDAFAAQVKTGVAWLEVGRENDPFAYKYRYNYVHRREIFPDLKAQKPDYSDAEYLVRSKWYAKELILSVFDKKKDLINEVANAWSGFSDHFSADQSTDLTQSYFNEKALTIDELEWRDIKNKRLRIDEVWYKQWKTGEIIKFGNDDVAEFDKANRHHIEILTTGNAELCKATYSVWRVSFWTGAHKLQDIANPYAHGKLPYVPMFGKREDMTNIPYGVIRPMITLQNEINARNTKMYKLLATKHVTMTQGVTVYDEEMVRQEAGRMDAMFVLDPQKLAQGGMFKVETDFELNQQQYQSLQDKRQSLKNVAGVYAAFEGSSNNQSGVALNSATEQSSQTLAEIYDNYNFATTQAGNLLLSLILEDIGDKQTEITIKKDFMPSKKVILNHRVTNEYGEVHISNSVQQASLKVSLSETPSTSSFRAQNYQSFMTTLQSLNPQLQAMLMKFAIKLGDFPDKQEILEVLAKFNGEEINKPPTNEQEAIAQQQAAQQAQMQAQMLQESATLDLDAKRATVEKLMAEAQKLTAEATPNTDELDQLKQQLAESQADLEQAVIEFDTSRLEIETNQALELEKARIQADADIQVAKINAQKDMGLQQLKAEMEQIEQLLYDSQPSVTGNQEQPPNEAVF